MIIFNLDGNTLSIVKKDDVIVQNSLRANEIFVIYDLAYSGKTATLTFERADGEVISDLLMIPTQKVIDVETKESRVGFYYKFSDRSITSVSGALKVAVKVFDYDYEGSDMVERIIATATETLVVSSSTVQLNSIPMITEAQFNSLLLAISELNQPLQVLPEFLTSNKDILDYLHDNDIYTAMTYDRKKLFYRTYSVGLGVEIVGAIGNSITTWRYVPEVEEMYNGLPTITQEAKWEVLFNVLDFGNLKNALPSGDTLETLLIDLRERTAKKDEANEFTQRQDFKESVRVIGGMLKLVSEARLTLGASNKETDKTKVSGIVVSENDSMSGAENGETHFTDLATFKDILFDLIGNATSEGYGYMSAQDKQRLDTIVSSFNDDDNNNVVDSIKEILQIFNNYPEGATIIEALADKVDKSVYEEFVSATNETLANHQRLIDKNIGDISKLTARTSAIESEQADINARLDNAQPLKVETRVSALENKTTELERKIDYLDNEIVVENTEKAMLYEIDIPDALLEYSQINEIGGMSYKSENLLSIEDKANTTNNGITYSISNGTISCNGTATSGFWNTISTLTLDAGTYYIYDLSGNSIWNRQVGINISGVGNIYNNTFTLTATTSVTLYINIYNGQTFNGIFKPMLVKGSVAPTEFKPYYSGLRNIMVDKVVVKGENLLKIADNTNNAYIKITNNKAVINGTISEAIWVAFGINGLKKGTYKIKAFSNNLTHNFIFRTLDSKGVTCDNTTFFSNNLTQNTITLSRDSDRIQLYILSGTYANEEIEFMLVKGNVAPTEYKPYQEINYLNEQIKGIQDLVQSEGYELGIGINDNLYNYIDFINKKAIIKCKSITLNGGESWQIGSPSTRFFIEGIGCGNTINIICSDSKYEPSSSGADNTITCQSTNGGRLNFYTTYSSINDFKSALASNPIEVVYELATPIEIDLSSVLTNVYDSVIRLIPNGYLTLHNTGDFNDFDNLVPISITTQQKKGNI